MTSRGHTPPKRNLKRLLSKRNLLFQGSIFNNPLTKNELRQGRIAYEPISLGSRNPYKKETPGLVGTLYPLFIYKPELVIVLYIPHPWFCKVKPTPSNWIMWAQWMPSRELTYPLPAGTFKSMMFLFPRWDMDSFPGEYVTPLKLSTSGIPWPLKWWDDFVRWVLKNQLKMGLVMTPLIGVKKKASYPIHFRPFLHEKKYIYSPGPMKIDPQFVFLHLAQTLQTPWNTWDLHCFLEVQSLPWRPFKASP